MASTKFLSNLVVDGAGGTVLDVQGSVGQLFSVTDSLTGDLFAVSDISGIPILNVNSSGAVDIDGTLTIDGNFQISGQILTPGGVNLSLNPNTGLVNIGGVIQATGTGANKFTGGLVLGTPSNGNLVNKLTIASGTVGDGIFLTGLGNTTGMATGNYKAIDFQYSNTDASFQSAIRFVVADSTAHGGQIEFFTDNSSGTNTKALTLDKSQNATFAGSVSIKSDNEERFLVRSNDYTISRIISRGNSGADLDKGLFSLMSSDGTNNNVEKVRIDSAGSSWFNGGAVSFGDNVTITGNLTVDGTTTTLNTTTVEVEDNILQLNTTQGTPDTATAATSGISVYRGNGVTQASFIFDDADDTWDLTNNLKVGGAIDATGHIQAFSRLYLRESIQILNKAGSGWLNFAARNTSASEAVYDLSNIGTLSTAGNATFAGAVSTGGYLTLNAADNIPRLVFNGGGDDFMFSNTANYFGLYNDTDSRWDIQVDGAGNTTFAGTVSSGAITSLAKGVQLGTSGYYINSTFKDTDSNVGVFTAHNDTANGVGAIAGINQLAFLTYGTAWTQALLLDSSQNATFAGSITATSANLTTSGTVLSLDRTGGATALIELKIGGTIEGYLGATTTKSLVVFNESAAEKFSISNTGSGTFAGTVTSPSFRAYTSSTTDSVLKLTDTGVADYDFTFPDTGTIQLATNTTSAKTFKLVNAGSGNFNFEADDATFAGNLEVQGGVIELLGGFSLQGTNGTYFQRIKTIDSSASDPVDTFSFDVKLGSSAEWKSLLVLDQHDDARFSGSATFAGAINSGKATATVSSGNSIEARKGAGNGAVGFGGTAHQTGLIEGVDGGGLKLYTAGSDVDWGGAMALNTTWSGTGMTVAGAVTTGGKLYIGTTSATATATTALLLGAAGEVKKRALGSNAFNSTAFSTASGVADNADVTPSWVPANDPSYLTSSSTQSKYLRSDAADSASELITFSKGISSDGNSKFYNWRALENSSNTSNTYWRIARVTGSQSSRFMITLAGRSTSYSNEALPAMGHIVGQLNNDNNYDVVFYNHSTASSEVVTEVGIVDAGDPAVDVYIRAGQFAELTATGHVSDGSFTVYANNNDDGFDSKPTGYVAVTEYTSYNSSNLTPLVVGTSATTAMAGNTLSAQDLTDIGNLSGTNTGDQSIASIKTGIGTGNGKLVPAAGTAGHFLKHDGTFGVPAYNTYTTSDFDAAGSADAVQSNLDTVAANIAGISKQSNTDVDTGTETIAQVSKGTYTAAFFDFVIKNGTNVRAGTVYSCHDGTNVEFTETSTVDLGDTSDVTLAVDISGTNMRLRATTTSNNWSVKSLVRAI